MTSLKLLLTYMLLLIFFGLKSQEVTVKYLDSYRVPFTVKQGLPSNNVLYAHSATSGLLWFGTDAGICSFDGSNFRTYQSKNLHSSIVIAIDEADDGTIWFATMDARLFEINHDTVRPHPFNDSISHHIPPNRVQDIAAFKGDHLMIRTRNGGYEVETKSIIEHFSKTEYDQSCYGFVNNLLVGCTYNFSSGPWVSRVVLPDTTIFIQDFEKPQPPFLSSKTYVFNNNHDFLFLRDQWLQHYQNGRLSVAKYSSTFTPGILWEETGRIILGTEKSGAIILEPNGQRKGLLAGKTVTSVVKDFQNGYWLACYGEGLYYFPNLAIEYLSYDREVQDVKVYNDHLFWQNSGLQWESRHSARHFQTPQYTDYHAVINEVLETEHELWYSVAQSRKDKILYRINFETQHISTFLTEGTIIMAQIALGDTILSSYGDAFLLDAGEIVPLSANNVIYSPKDIMLSPGSESVMLIATGEGLSKTRYNQGDGYLKVERVFRKDLAFTQLFELDGQIIASSSNGVLFSFDPEKETLQKIEANQDLFLNADYRVDDQILLGTTRGLFVLSHTDQGEFEIQDVGSKIGLESELIRDIEKIGDTLYLATSSGLVQLPVQQIHASFINNSRLLIESIDLNNLGLSLKDVSETENLFQGDHIRFSTRYINFKNRSNRRYSYRLLPIDTTWTYTSNTDISFFDLPGGALTFQLSIDGELVEAREVNVRRKYYQYTAFQIFSLIALLLLFILPFYYRHSLRMAHLEHEKEVGKLQFKNLTSQLKPHFVFNALTSIQSYILKNETAASSEYLAKFAQYIRNALDQSKRDFIRLDQSLISIENYLELEKMRLSNRFDFRIEVKEGTDTRDVFIPSMLIQPYVENAIFHGVSSIDYQGEIKLVIESSENGDMTITIRDNGKGMTNALDSSTQGHGTGVNEQRLGHLNKLIQSSYKVTITSNAPEKGVTTTITFKPLKHATD